MNKPMLSVLMPAIRKPNWEMIYDSLGSSCRRYTFELIIAGPLSLPKRLQEAANVKYIKDFGSPTRAQNMAGLLAEGTLLLWIADDGRLLPDALDKNIDILFSMGDNYRNVVLAKYFEGRTGDYKPLQPDSYFQIPGSPIRGTPYVPPQWYTYNCALMYRKFYEELGGMDCIYEANPMACFDLGLRAQALGATTVMTQIPIADCDWAQNDHRAIEIGQGQFDEPRMREKYFTENWQTKFPLCVPLDNWKNSPNVWKRRFNQSLPKSYEDIVAQNWTATI